MFGERGDELEIAVEKHAALRGCHLDDAADRLAVPQRHADDAGQRRWCVPPTSVSSGSTSRDDERALFALHRAHDRAADV